MTEQLSFLFQTGYNYDGQNLCCLETLWIQNKGIHVFDHFKCSNVENRLKTKFLKWIRTINWGYRKQFLLQMRFKRICGISHRVLHAINSNCRHCTYVYKSKGIPWIYNKQYRPLVVNSRLKLIVDLNFSIRLFLVQLSFKSTTVKFFVEF